MCALSNHIREKPNWWEKVKGEVIVEKWRGEALQQEEEKGGTPSRRLTATMVEFYHFWIATLASLLSHLGQLRTRGAPRVRIFA